MRYTTEQFTDWENSIIAENMKRPFRLYKAKNSDCLLVEPSSKENCFPFYDGGSSKISAANDRVVAVVYEGVIEIEKRNVPGVDLSLEELLGDQSTFLTVDRKYSAQKPGVIVTLHAAVLFDASWAPNALKHETDLPGRIELDIVYEPDTQPLNMRLECDHPQWTCVMGDNEAKARLSRYVLHQVYDYWHNQFLPIFMQMAACLPVAPPLFMEQIIKGPMRHACYPDTTQF